MLFNPCLFFVAIQANTLTDSISEHQPFVPTSSQAIAPEQLAAVEQSDPINTPSTSSLNVQVLGYNLRVDQGTINNLNSFYQSNLAQHDFCPKMIKQARKHRISHYEHLTGMRKSFAFVVSLHYFQIHFHWKTNSRKATTLCSQLKRLRSSCSRFGERCQCERIWWAQANGAAFRILQRQLCHWYALSQKVDAFKIFVFNFPLSYFLIN